MDFTKSLSIRPFRLVAVISTFLFFNHLATAGYSITQFANAIWCQTSYPTAYVQGSFSIAETNIKNNNGFTKGQSNVTLILGLSGGSFAFNPGVGTVTVTGTEVTIHSYTITATNITVTLSTSATNVEQNVLQFNGIEVRATAAGTGNIVRSGGTMKIDNKTTKPPSTLSWGALAANTPIAYSSSTATQTASTVFAGTDDNLIIGMQVVVTGNCSSTSVTQFNLNTTGSTNTSADITSAKIYYTGTSNVFATTTLFGSFSAPNGSYSITGNETLTTAGTYYFWLVYDVPITATNSNSLDAQFTSVIVGGNTQTPSVTNPAGVQTISTNVYYSIADGTWSNTTTVWSRSSGGSACSCAPTDGNGLVFINHAVVLNGTYTVNVVNVQNGGTLTRTSGALTVPSLNTSGNGSFTISGSAWTLTAVTLAGTGTSSSSVSQTIGGALTIGNGTIFQMSAVSGTTLTLNGNLSVNGTLALGGNNMTHANANTISGAGSVTGTGTITLSAAKTISTGSTLTINTPITISNNITITNNGSVTLTSNLTGGNANSTWVNAANSSLTMAGTTSALLSTGTLTATSSPNTVTYSGSGAQTIKNTTYHNLTMGNANTKTLGGATTVNNNLTLSGAASLAAGANNLSVGGNWINNSSGTYSSTGTTTFSGLTATITGTGTTNFGNLTISGELTSHPTTGRVIVTGVFTNNGTFNHNNSDISFTGTSSLAGSETFEFYHLNVTSGTLTFPTANEISIEGDLTVSGTLTHSTSTLLFVGSGTQNIQGATATQTFYGLTLDNGGTLQLSKPIIITNALTLTSGIINTSSTNTLTVNQGATLTGGSSTAHINGPMTHVATGNAHTKVFPIGKGGIYRPVTLTISASGSPTSNYTAEVFNSAASGLGYTFSDPIKWVSGIRYWNITQSNATGFIDARATLTYGAGDEVAVPANLVIAKSSGSTWVNIGGTGSGTPSGTIQSDPFSTFSIFTLANIGEGSGEINPLPVELVYFTALPNNGRVDLAWRTATELNNEDFTVERSRDGVRFDELFRVSGNGTTNEAHDYRASDMHPLPGVSYYRLRQTDFDGTTETFNIVRVSFEAPFGITAYPTRVNSFINLQLSSGDNDELTISILDMGGKLHYREKIPTTSASHSLRIDQLDRLPAGSYFIQAANSKHSAVQRFVKE
jgi:hypothetical protein